MNRKFFLGIGLAIALVFAGFAFYFSFTLPQVTAGVADNRETLYQVSTIDALMQGVYEGFQPVGELKRHGDFGIGTFDALDGEMIVLDGTVYQAKADGTVSRVPDSITTPFAAVTYFDRDFAETTRTPMNFSEFSSAMEGQLPSRNMVYAIRIHGIFPLMNVRAIPAQQKPYPLLIVAAKNQSVYTYSHTKGTVLGFYIPVFLRGLNMPGCHLHYLSDDTQTGGHVLDFTVPANTTVEYDITPSFLMELPANNSFASTDLAKDLSGDLKVVEN
jgi:acetolactate decarboxylase